MLIILIKIVFISIISYPISHYLMKKGMDLDMEMPSNVKKYNNLSNFFRIPIINVLIMFCYFSYCVHKFKRLS